MTVQPALCSNVKTFRSRLSLLRWCCCCFLGVKWSATTTSTPIAQTTNRGQSSPDIAFKGKQKIAIYLNNSFCCDPSESERCIHIELFYSAEDNVSIIFAFAREIRFAHQSTARFYEFQWREWLPFHHIEKAKCIFGHTKLSSGAKCLYI